MMKKELIESISKMIVNGKRLELPQDEHFDNYAQVKKCLLLAGGKYKKCGFEFGENAQEIKDRLIGGEAIDDKKKFQFFATPDALARRLVDMAYVTDNCRVLEPSAGQGAISNLVRDLADECVVVELMPQNAKALRRQGYDVKECDFLTLKTKDIGMFDRIIANPPFTKNQDIDHIIHMMTLLKPGGKLVSVASQSWTFGSQKKQLAFRGWLDVLNAKITELDAGEFKASGTNIQAVIVEIELPLLTTTITSFSEPVKGKKNRREMMKKKNAGIGIERFKCDLNREANKDVITKRANSIKRNGLIHPISVQSLDGEADYDFIVVAGRVRFFALKKLGMKALTENDEFRVMDDADPDLISFIENDERKDLSLAEQVAQLEKLSGKCSIKDLAVELGRTPKWVALRINLGNLSEAWTIALAENEYPALRAGHYEIVAKYSADRQDELITDYQVDLHDPGTIKEFQTEIEEMYHHRMVDAPWSLTEKLLLNKAPCCDCSRRQSQTEWLFDDMVDENEDQCLDSECWKNYLETHIEQQLEKINKRGKDEPVIRLICDQYWTNKKGILTKHDYKEIKSKKSHSPNVFNIDTGKYEYVKINKKTAGIDNSSTYKKQPKTLQDRLDELRHKREKVAVQAVIDVVKNEDKRDYIIPDHETMYRLGTLLSPEGIGSWNGKISNNFEEGWKSVQSMPMAELDQLYWENLKDELCHEMNIDIAGTLDRIMISHTVIICGLLIIDWAKIWEEAVLAVKEPKTLTKMIAEKKTKKK
jgi:ParB-like nuclease family protein